MIGIGAIWRRRLSVRRLALTGDNRGSAVIEFALLAPVFVVLLSGVLDLAHTIYVRSVLNGAIRDAARAGSLEGATTTTLDNSLKGVLGGIAPNATYTVTRQSYFDFSDVNRPERWTDSNGNGTCDNNEAYVDENKNGNWNADVGASGNGGASDVVKYTVRLKFDRVFAFGSLLGGDGKYTMDATTVVKNQPFALQQGYGSGSGTCS
jgi:Flp pilus assembly protein TadG